MSPARSTPIRLAVLISGGGTTLQNLIDRIADGRLSAEIAIVVSSSAKAHGLVRAERAGLETAVVRRRDFADVPAFSAAVFDQCRRHEVDLVAMAGFLKFVEIPEDFAGRVINIHPALLPSFGGEGYYGRRVHEAVLEHGCKISGCTVHFADNEYDHGPIILQRCVAVQEDDTPETLAARVFEQECEAYPQAIGLYAQRRLLIDDGRVRIAPELVA